MQVASPAVTQSQFEDSPSISAVLRAPNLFVRESLAGVITALALIPEVISFSFVSGVDPKVALVASIVLCRDCGHVVSCIRCSSPLVLHNVDLAPQADGRIEAEPRGAWDTILRCHTCGYRELPPEQCPNCWSSRIRHFGVGSG